MDLYYNKEKEILTVKGEKGIIAVKSACQLDMKKAVGFPFQEGREDSRPVQTRTDRSSACPIREEGAFLAIEVRVLDAFDRTVDDHE